MRKNFISRFLGNYFYSYVWSGKVYNDYGQGFYCTESLELAKGWSCAEREDGYVNQYEMDETGLLILNLMEKHYSVLHWLAI